MKSSAARTAAYGFLAGEARDGLGRRRLPLARRHHPFLLALDRLDAGSLDLDLPGGVRLQYDSGRPGTRAHMQFHGWEPVDRLLSHGDLGWGEDYALGRWDTEDLQELMDFVGENAGTLEDFSNGNALFRLASRLKRRVLSNAPERAKENVLRHYDLGNDFYKEWLDPGMTYSCALFRGDRALGLEAAQDAKYARILERLNPAPGSHILEIGCGWGGFMEAAARRGARVTGLTLSEEQADYAQARLSTRGFGRLARVRLQDYREAQGMHDHIVSIGMFEHVGEAYWDAYMQCLHRCLKAGGQAMVQSILVREDLFEFYRASSGFIREHIFPGGMLPTRRLFTEAAERAGLMVKDVFHFGPDYAITLGKWLERFDARLPRIRALGYDEAFIRKWRFYLAYCAAMFRAGRIDVMQAQLARAD